MSCATNSSEPFKSAERITCGAEPTALWARSYQERQEIMNTVGLLVSCKKARQVEERRDLRQSLKSKGWRYEYKFSTQLARERVSGHLHR